ncbi:MAG: hypothetical protein IJ857_05465 [Lachnospiraceae bacterium]|nr:hypothetical protein [Lachnospiraceae bacterium]
MRPKKIKPGNQKIRLTDLEKLWYYDPYFVDYALHDDRGKPWKIHKKRINPLVFPPIIELRRNMAKYALQTVLALFLLIFAIFMNYGSQIIDWIVSYNIQLTEMLDEREKAEAEKRAKLLALSAEGFKQKMDEDADDNMDDSLYDKADHLTMDELELSTETTAPLTSSEILTADDIKNILSITWISNEGLSDEEYRIVKSALLTVGRIPYILGGAQPTRPSNTEKNEEGFPVVPDDAIVSFANQISGMDCSHWVDWIYFLAMNDNLGYCNTDSMIYTQGNGSLQLIAVDEEGTDYDEGLKNIRAGDIMVYGFDASHRFGHAAIFLGYASLNGSEDLDMMYVHESSTAGNVSFHVGDVFGNNGSSPVFYFRYKTLDGSPIDYDYDYLRQIQEGVRNGSGDDEEIDDTEEEEDDEDYDDEDYDDEEEDEEDEDEEDDEVNDSASVSDSNAGNESSESTDSSESSDDDDDDDYDDDDDDDDESYSQYQKDQEAESYKPEDPESSDLHFGKEMIIAP